MRSRARTVRMPAEDRTRRCTSRAPVRLVAALPDNRIADPIIQPASGAVYVHVGRAKWSQLESGKSFSTACIQGRATVTVTAGAKV